MLNLTRILLAGRLIATLALRARTTTFRPSRPPTDSNRTARCSSARRRSTPNS